ncbi:tail protein [Sphingomonas phage Lucius]|uniref:Tail protein n=1 Tax=Sphingomonas phage Lucius TaxID=2686313 RepID=A0A6M3T9V1_9CAUD|nr:tail protein [Sphingomonas phage Lucius]QJD54461.1 tail protein [Sphingomonas phage Lucius]
MGGKSKKQTVGYKYYLGMHLALCHGPIDAITRLRVDDRDAWTGKNTGGTINVNAADLFGGEKREGGVSGSIDVAMGGPAQGQNSYLVSKLGALIPAYRGVVGLIFKQCYLGNNPYLKQWNARGQRVYVRQNGIAQWYSAKAGILSASNAASFALAETFYTTGGIAPGAFHPATLVIGPFDKSVTIIAGLPDGSNQAVGDNVFVFNGVDYPYPPSYPHVTTIAGGTPIYTLPAGQTLTVRIKNLDSGSPCGASGYISVGGLAVDMNPAHIIRECLTDPEWGMGYTDDDIDDVSFTSAADTFYNEGLGVSLLWDKTKKIDDFVSLVQEHVDCALYVSRTTGKFVIKPIRGGYDEATLLHLDESNIVSVDDPTRVAFGELTNSVTVSYWDNSTGKDASVTVTDTALVQQQGVVINAPLQYPGFTNARNATIAAQRDLRALSSPLLSCTITADSDAKVLNIGDVFKFSWSRWGLVEVVMRVNGISYGTGRNNRVKISCTQDVFDTDTTVAVVVPEPGWTDPSAPPSASENELATEAPYYELVQALGQSDIDNKLLTHPEIGYVIAAASRPASAINASLYTDNDDGSGYGDVGAMDFAPSGTLTTDITKTQPNFVLSNGEDLEEIVIGTHVQIGEELMRVDAIDAVTGAVMVGRGVLDTVPQVHSAGDVALFWDAYAGFDPTEYVEGEEIKAKIIPVSGAGVLPLDAATEHTVEIAGRAARPYAPGDLRINGESYIENAFYEGEVSVSWTDRDRLQQTAGVLIDHTAGNIGPEAGTTYRLRVYVDDVLDQEIEPAVSPQLVTPLATGFVRIEVHAKRDDLYSWQAPSHEFINANLRLTESADHRYTEDGDVRSSED